MVSLSSHRILEILCDLLVLEQLEHYLGMSILKEAGITLKVTLSQSVYYIPS
jgi:hypothetical protein